MTHPHLWRVPTRRTLRSRAWTARRRGSRPHLSAALALSRAFASARFAFARRPLRGDEEAGIRQQDLRAGAAEFAAPPLCADSVRAQPGCRSIARTRRKQALKS